MAAVVDLQFLARDIRIFYPWEAELPVDLLVAGGLDTARIADLANAPLVRVAKTGGQVISAYLSTVETPQCHRLESLAVLPDWRNRGVGSWMVGHALGVSESRGAREFRARAGTGADGLLARLRFERAGEDWLMRLEPE